MTEHPLSETSVNPCPHCDGRGWVRDKPWKPGRDWFFCPYCKNAALLAEPERRPTPEDEMK